MDGKVCLIEEYCTLSQLLPPRASRSHTQNQTTDTFMSSLHNHVENDPTIMLMVSIRVKLANCTSQRHYKCLTRHTTLIEVDCIWPCCVHRQQQPSWHWQAPGWQPLGSCLVAPAIPCCNNCIEWRLLPCRCALAAQKCVLACITNQSGSLWHTTDLS